MSGECPTFGMEFGYWRCCVYAISDGTGNVKVGVAQHPVARRDALQIGNAYGLQVLFYFWCKNRSEANRYEKRIHSRVSDCAVLGGREWFRISWHDAYHVFSEESSDVVIHTSEKDHVWWHVSSMELTHGR